MLGGSSEISCSFSPMPRIFFFSLKRPASNKRRAPIAVGAPFRGKPKAVLVLCGFDFGKIHRTQRLGVLQGLGLIQLLGRFFLRCHRFSPSSGSRPCAATIEIIAKNAPM